MYNMYLRVYVCMYVCVCVCNLEEKIAILEELVDGDARQQSVI
jgi:hypothetical protein